MSWTLLGACLFASATLVTVALLVLGLRGRRVDDHPLCRRCGYDLTGRAGGAGQCPECGADLAAAGAVRVGHRRRRGGLVWFGATLLAACLLVAATLGAMRARGFNWQAHKPVWWLLREAAHGDAAAQKAAFDELGQRGYQKRLTPAEQDRIADAALDAQADRARPWDRRWAGLVVRQHFAGTLSAARTTRFAGLSCPTVTLTVRPRVRRGDPVPARVSLAQDRVGEYVPLFLQTRLPSDGRRVDGLPLPAAKYESHLLFMLLGSGPAMPFNDADFVLPFAPPLATLPDGRHTLAFDQPRHVDASVGGKVTGVYDDRVPLSASFEIVPADEPTVTMTHDPSARAGVEAGLRVSDLIIDLYGGGGGFSHCTVEGQGLPVGVGMDAFVRIGGREWPVGGFGMPAGGTHTARLHASLADVPAGTKTDKADLVLRPSAAAAAATVDTFAIWDEGVTLHDVPAQTTAARVQASRQAVAQATTRRAAATQAAAAARAALKSRQGRP